jgi:hypothetical protein
MEVKNRRSNGETEHFIPIKISKGTVPVETVEVRKGDRIIWKAIDSDVTFFFPDPNLFGETLGSLSKGKYKEVKVMLGSRSKSGDKYYYAVYHYGLKNFGHGNSNPVIIIRS